MKSYTVSFFQNPKKERESICEIDFWEWFYSALNKPFWGFGVEPNSEQKAKFIPTKNSAISICGQYYTIIRGRCSGFSGLMAITIKKSIDLGWFGFESIKSKLKESEHILYCGFVDEGKTLLCIMPTKDPSLAIKYYSQLEKYFRTNYSVSIDAKFPGLRYLVSRLDDRNPIINKNAKDFVFNELESSSNSFRNYKRRKKLDLTNKIERNDIDYMLEGLEDAF